MQRTSYPPSPAHVPAGLTALTTSYQLRAALAVISIALFFALYFALVVALGYLVYLAVIYEITHINKFTILLKLGAIAGAAMLFAFTLKFIFKLKNHVPENRIELDRVKHASLFDLVNNICVETKAPRPRKIFVDPDVNAYVAYTNTWLSLFLPVPKDLTIGLGLVSILDRSEFKAVVAHEFGHFAQRSMKIGSYIVSANTIIHDMIFSRDKWDNVLEEWRGADLRLSAAAWAITPIIWCIRKTLSLFYLLLNRLHSSLSREMEFNADKVAVSTSGSEAIISALWKLDEGHRHWTNTMEHAYLAAQKNIFVRDLYHHNDLAIQRGQHALHERLLQLPQDPRGGSRFFSSSENSKVNMYASHPPNDQREQSAKDPFVACERDPFPAWGLVSGKAELCEQMTTLLYEKYLQKQPKEYLPAEAFEAFVKAESEGAELIAEHHDTFVSRFLHLPSEEEAVSARRALAGIDPLQRAKQLKDELIGLMRPVKDIEELAKQAQQIADGTTKLTTFSFMGENFDKRTLNNGFQKLMAERERLFNESFKEWDVSFTALYGSIADATGDTDVLKRMYAQHAKITEVYRALAGGRNSILSEVQKLQERGEVQQSEVRDLCHWIDGVVREINKLIASIAIMDMVPMPNIDSAEELQNAVIEGGKITEGSVLMFENGDFNRLMGDLDRCLGHCQRIDQKSIACILSFHKKLEEKIAERVVA